MSAVRNRSTMFIALTVAVVVTGFALVLRSGVDPAPVAAATTPTTPTADTVSVSGTGSVEGKPDTLVANLRVHAVEGTVQQALNAAAGDARNVLRSLRSSGVALPDIKTTDVSLNPDYNNHGQVDGYSSSESITVSIHPLSNVGKVLTAAASSAGNSVNIEGLSFDIADNSALLAQARAAAFDNAKASAAQYAKLGGRTLGRAMTITAVVHNASPAYAARGALYDSAMGAAKALPIRAGQKKLSVTVKVVWALA
jgi:uncharacterized protein